MGQPPTHFPRLRAAAILSRVRSLISSLSRASTDLGKEFEAYLKDPHNEVLASSVAVLHISDLSHVVGPPLCAGGQFIRPPDRWHAHQRSFCVVHLHDLIRFRLRQLRTRVGRDSRLTSGWRTDRT